MEDFKELKTKLDELRIDILNLTNSEYSNQDLHEQFYKVRDISPEIYELLILMYNEFQMTNKSNKKQFLLLTDKALNIKHQTVNKLIYQSRFSKTIKNRLIDAITYSNIKRALFLISLIFLFIFGIYEIDPNAFSALNDVIQQTLKTILNKE